MIKHLNKPALGVVALLLLAGWMGVAYGADIIATIPDGSITSRMLSTGAVDTAKIVHRAVTGDKIAIRAVTLGNIADNAINSYKVRDGSLTGADLANGSVTAADLRGGSVTPVQAPFALAGESNGMRVEVGQVTLAVDGAGTVGPVTANFADAFATPPTVIVSFASISANTGDYGSTSVNNLTGNSTTTQVRITANVVDPGVTSSQAVVSWVAIGK